MSETKMTGRKVNKPSCATVRNQATALFSLPMRLGQHVASCREQKFFEDYCTHDSLTALFRKNLFEGKP